MRLFIFKTLKLKRNKRFSTNVSVEGSPFKATVSSMEEVLSKAPEAGEAPPIESSGELIIP